MENTGELFLTIASDKEMIDNSVGRPVLNGKTFDSRFQPPQPFANGLYDRSIFGILHKCTCGITRNDEKGTKKYCPACNDLVFGDLDTYRNNYSYFKLCIPVCVIPKAIPFATELNNVFGQELFGTHNEREAINDLWSYAYTFTAPTSYIVSVRCGNNTLYVTPINSKTRMDELGLLGLIALNDKMTNGQRLNTDLYITTILPIISTYHRKMVNTIINNSSRLELDDNKALVQGYQTVIEITKMINDENLIDQIHDPIELSNLFYNYNWAVNVTLQQVELLSPTKEHLTRDITRFGIKGSIYSTISPCMDIDMNHIMVPRDISYPALDKEIIKKIKEISPTSVPIMEYKKGATGNSDIAERAYQEVLKDSVCAFWRNPTLHQGSYRALKPISWNNLTIGVPVEVLAPMTADYDGDACACIFITDKDDAERAFERMRSDNNWFYPKNDEPIYVPEHEILFGLAIASKVVTTSKKNIPIYTNIIDADADFQANKIGYNEIINVEDKTSTYGRLKISDIIGEDIDNIIGKDSIINGDNISLISVSISKKKNRAEIMHALNKFGAEIVTREGISTSFEDVYNDKDPKIQKILASTEPDEEKLQNLNTYIKGNIVDTFKKEADGNIALAFETKSRVKPDTLMDLYGPDIHLNENDKLIYNNKSSIFKGMTEEQFAFKGSENRVIQSFKKAGTPSTGYISRQLISTLIKFTYKDVVGSTDETGLLLDRDMAIGRTTLRGTKVSPNTPTDKNGKVRVRSNMFSKSNVVYKDEVSDKLARSFKDGDSVGVTLATSMTEKSTQGVFGLKHGRGRLTKYDIEDIAVSNSGTITSLPLNEDDKFLIITTSDGAENKYRVTKAMSCDSNLQVGDYVKAGDIVIHAIREATLGDNIKKQALLFKFRLANDIYTTGEVPDDTTTALCYAPFPGVIKYDDKGDLLLNDLKIKVTENLIPLKKNGDKVELNERLFASTTCTLDLSSYFKARKDYLGDETLAHQDCFDLMLKEANSCGLGLSNPEGFEILYKVISQNNYNTHNAPKNVKNIFDRLYYEDKYAGIHQFITNQAIKDKTINVDKSENGLVLDLLISG